MKFVRKDNKVGNYMSTKLLRNTALAAAFAVMMTAMCSCGDERTDTYKGDYNPNGGHSNNNVIVTPDTEDYCEAPASADEF